MSESPRVPLLVADDQPDVTLALQLLLKSEGYAADAVDTPAAIVEAVRTRPYALILMDLNYTRDTTSGEEGLGVLETLQRQPGCPPVIVMTAWGSVELAVEAMRRGARDFVMKPWDNAKLLSAVRAHLAPREAPPARDRDLEIARRVQNRLLASRHRPLRTLAVAGHCRQAGAVGGDYYDFLDLGAGRLGLVLADIAGKGIGAALLMAHLQASLRSLSWQAAQNLAVMLKTINLQFRESTSPEHYATLFFADYDDAHRTLRWANCGHLSPFLLRDSGPVERLEPTATVIGVFESYPVEVVETQIHPGDRLVIYSDGATEAEDAQGHDLGDDGFLRMLRDPVAAFNAWPETLADRISARSQGRLADDCTIVAALGLPQ